MISIRAMLVPLQGSVWLEMELSPTDLASALEQVHKRNFQRTETATGDTLSALRLNKSRAAYFSFERGKASSNENIVLLDSAARYLWFYFSQTTNSW